MFKMIPLIGVSLVLMVGCSPQTRSQSLLLNTPLASRVADTIPKDGFSKAKKQTRKGQPSKKLDSRLSRTVAEPPQIAACRSDAQPFGGGLGTARDPYLICSRTHWEAMNDQVAFFKLSGDLSFNGGGVSPIDHFRGWFDGSGYRIYGFENHNTPLIRTVASHAYLRRLRVSQGKTFYDGFHAGPAALFVSENYGVLEELVFDRSISLELESSQEWDRYGVIALDVGLVASRNFGTIENVQIQGSVRGRNVFRMGGFVGSLEGRIRKSSFEGEIVSMRGAHIGGVAGQMLSGSTISDCDLNGAKVQGSLHVGGLVGSVDGAAISAVSISRSSVLGERFVGGVAGTLVDGEISDVEADLVAYGRDQVGGVVGRLDGPRAEVRFAKVRFHGGGGASWGPLVRGGAFGGLIGALYSGRLTNSEAHGEVSTWARGDIGGAIGYLGVPGRRDVSGAQASGIKSTARVSGAGRVGGLVGSLFGKVLDSKVETLEVSCRNSYGDGAASSVGGVAGLFGGKLVRTRSSAVLSSVGCPEPAGLVGAMTSSVHKGDITYSYYDHRVAGLTSDPGLGALMHSIDRKPAANEQSEVFFGRGVFRPIPRIQY